MNTTTKTRKVGTNRGKARIWLEGKELTDCGINHGMRFDVDSPEEGVMHITINPNGKRKIAGKADRPIIDMSGGTVTKAGFEAGDTFQINRIRNGIELRWYIEQ